MTTNSRPHRLLISSVLFYMVIGVVNARAGEHEGGGDEQDQATASVHGVVFQVSGNTIKILNGAITIDATGASVQSDHNNAPLTLADVQVGRRIDAAGSSQSGTFKATRITVEGPASDGELSAVVESVDTAHQTLTILGKTVALTPATIFEPAGATLASISPGGQVDVEVTVVGTSLVATRITLQESEQDQQGEH